MPAAQRQPLNHDAADLVAAREYKPLPLRDEIDHWRREVQKRRHQLDIADRYAGHRYIPAGLHILTPEVAGIRYRRAKTVLHYLLALEERERNTEQP